MAVNLERTQTGNITINLEQIVQARLEAFSQARGEVQASEETKFYQEIQNGMSYADQMAFRQAQLDRENRRDVPDANYIRSLTRDISTLRKAVTAEKFKKDYLDNYTKLASGLESYDDHIRFLQDQLNKSADPEQQATIRDFLSKSKIEASNQTKKITDNYYDYAIKDNTVPVLNKALSDATAEKAKALGSGDQARASALTLKIQSLQQNLQTSQIEQSLHEFSIRTLRSYNPSDLINSLNEQIDSANTDTPINYNGQRYNSAREFWQSQKSDYFNSGKFATAATKYYGDVMQLAQNESMDAFPNRLGLIKSEFDNLASRSDLADYQQVIKGTAGSILNKGADMAAKYILDKSRTDYDFQTAANSLSTLQRTVGIDQSSSYQSLLSDMAQIKGPEVNAISTRAAELGGGTITSDSMNRAIAEYNSGQLGATISPKDTATTSVAETAKKATGITPVKPAEPVQTPSNLAKFSEGSVIKSPDSSTVYLVKNGQLSAISGQNVSEQQFKSLTGKSWADVQTVPDFNNLNLPKGQDIVVEQQPTPASTSAPTLVKVKGGQGYQQFAPQTVFLSDTTGIKPISSEAAMKRVAPGLTPTEVSLDYFTGKQLGEAIK